MTTANLSLAETIKKGDRLQVEMARRDAIIPSDTVTVKKVIRRNGKTRAYVWSTIYGHGYAIVIEETTCGVTLL